MTDLFGTAMDFVWGAAQDGQPFHMSSNDPGGATAWGCTYRIWSAWEQQHGRSPTLAAFRTLPKEAFLPIYLAWYWNATRCEEFGALGVQMMDAACNCGPGNAIGFLQHVLNVKVDDQIGPLTLAVTQQTDQRALSRQLCAQREEFYATRLNARYFESGWDARAERCRDLVLGMLGVPPAVSSAKTDPEKISSGADESDILDLKFNPEPAASGNPEPT